MEILFALCIAGAAAWYCYRWGHADGHADGYDEGRQKGLLEAAGIVTPSAVGGPGPVPR